MHVEQARRQTNVHTGLGVVSRRARTALILLALATALLGCLPLFAGGPAAQKNQKDKKQEADTTPITSPIPPPDGQAVDTVVSQMLGSLAGRRRRPDAQDLCRRRHCGERVVGASATGLGQLPAAHIKHSAPGRSPIAWSAATAIPR